MGSAGVTGQHGCVRTGGLFSVRLLVVRSGVALCGSAAMHPGNFLARAATEIEGCLMQRQLGGSRPQLKLIALAVAAMATVTTDRHVHGEASMTSGRGFVQGTTSVPLVARSLAGLEAEQVEHLLHRDLCAKPVEVDPWHDAPFLRWVACWTRAVPFPFNSIGGTGTPPGSVDTLPTGGRAADPAGLLPTTPGPRPGVRSSRPGCRGAWRGVCTTPGASRSAPAPGGCVAAGRPAPRRPPDGSSALVATSSR